MKRTLASLMLTFVFCLNVYAGDIPTLPGPQPPPQGISSSQEPGDIPTSGAVDQITVDAWVDLLTMLVSLSV